MSTFEIGSASDVAVKIAQSLPQSTSQTARELYRVLVEVAVETSRRRGHAPSTVEVVMHLPLERLADVAGVSRVTAWRHLPALRALGVVDYKVHKASCRGETRNSGCVWRVRLSPLRGCRARVSADDMRYRWRDLDGDVRRGRTSYGERARLKHTETIDRKLLEVESLLLWTLPPSRLIEPDALVCFSPAQVRLEALLDVTGAAREDRSRVVDLGAQALAQVLRDRGGVDWYRKLLWQLLRRYDSTGQDESYRVFLAAQRAATDAREWSGLRRPGALLQSRLRGGEWFAQMMAAPPTRVGMRPLEA